MITLLAAASRRPGATYEEFRRHYEDVHGALTVETPVSMRRYVQNHVLDGAYGDGTADAAPAPRDSVSELVWDSPEDLLATLAHEHVRETIGPDLLAFTDASTSVSVIVGTTALETSAVAHESDLSVFHFLHADDELRDQADFAERWASAHRDAVGDPTTSSSMTAALHHAQISEMADLAAAMGSAASRRFRGVGAYRFAESAGFAAFRLYARRLGEANEDPSRAFFDPARSFSVLVRPVTRYEKSDGERTRT